MSLLEGLKFKPMLMVLAIAMMAVGLACAGEEAADTAADSSAAAAPTATAAAAAAATDDSAADDSSSAAVAEATSEPVPDAAAAADLGVVEALLASPGYKAEWGQPVSGGILKMRHPWAASYFLPNANSVFHSNHGPPMYHDGLVQFDPWVGVDSIIPRMAKSWEISEDGKTYTFKLVEGIKFQDNPLSTAPDTYLGNKVKGDEFVCEDVAASLEFHARPPSTEPRMLTGKIGLGHVNSVTCPEGARGYTAVFNLDTPSPATLGWMAEGGFVMMDKDWLLWYDAEVPGLMNKGTKAAMMIASSAGPWQPKQFVPSITMKMERNPNYFLEGLPFADEWHLVYISDFATAFTALATGQVHIFGACSGTMQPGQVLQAERDFRDSIKVSRSRHGMGQGISINMRVEPFDDVRVRQAINLALDRQGWYAFKNISELGGGLTYSSYYPADRPYGHTEAEVLTWPGINPDTKEADIAEANRLLDEVFGVGKRFKATLEPSNQANYIDISLYTKDTLETDLGIEFDVMVNEPAVGAERAQSGVKSLGPSTGGVATWFGDPDGSLLRWTKEFASGTTIKYLAPGWEAMPEWTDNFHEMAYAQRSMIDVAERTTAVRHLSKTLHQDFVPSFLLGWNVLFYGEVPALGGFTVPDFGVVIGMGLYERLWLTGKTRYAS